MRAADVLLGAVIALAAFLAYFHSPIQKMGDSEFTVLLSEQIATEGSCELDAYFWPNQPVRFFPGMKPGMRWPRQVQPGGVRRAERSGVTEGPLFYIYPHGTSLLSIPIVLATRAVGFTTVAADGAYDPAAERRVQRIAASLLIALAAALLFTAARQVLGRGSSAAVALSAAFATQLWSTASRSLQSHTWTVVLLSLVCLALTRRAAREAAPGRSVPHGVWVGTLLSWCFLVRPTAVFFIVPLTVYVLARERRAGVAAIATGLAWLAAFFGYSQAVFGTWLPDYYTRGSGFEAGGYLTGLAGQLVSPSRGLFVLVPLSLGVAYLVARYRRHLPLRPLCAAAVVCVVLHTATMASFRNWWGGHGFGARFSTDLVPLFALLGALGLAARAAASPSARTRRLENTALVAAALVGALLNGAGAISTGGEEWNRVPVPIGEDPDRCFDWTRSQPVCALLPDRLPERKPR